MSLDGLVVGAFDGYISLEILPSHMNFDRFVRYAVGKLSDRKDRDKAMRILKDVDPRDSANYLVGALGDERARPSTMQLLSEYGPCVATVNPLVGALEDLESRPFAERILFDYGPCETTVNSLVGAFSDPGNREDCLVNILVAYWPSNILIRPLLNALADEPSRELAKRVFFESEPNDILMGTLFNTVKEGDDDTRQAIKEIMLDWGPTISNLVGSFHHSPDLQDYVGGILIDMGVNSISLGLLIKAYRRGHCKGPIDKIFRTYHSSEVAKFAVGALEQDNSLEGAMRYLELHGPSKYTVEPLVAALKDIKRRKYAAEVLKNYGPKDVIMGYLVKALPDIDRQEIITEIIHHYGPKRVVMKHLLENLSNSRRQKPITNVIHGLGASNYTVHPLRRQLGDTLKGRAAEKVLVGFGDIDQGQECLDRLMAGRPALQRLSYVQRVVEQLYSPPTSLN